MYKSRGKRDTLMDDVHDIGERREKDLKKIIYARELDDQLGRFEQQKEKILNKSDQRHIMRHQLPEIKQKKHETLEEFAEKIEEIFTEAYPYSCPDPDTVTSPQETTEATHVEIVTRKYSTTASPNEKGNLKYKDIVDEIVMKLILAGVLIPITIVCILCILRVIYIRKATCGYSKNLYNLKKSWRELNRV
uniref:Uncharacterized protein n=1 Tax=Magallana gigas TaxID=29159 RepID=K1QH29_MAGGI